MKRAGVGDAPKYFRVAAPRGEVAGVDRDAGEIRGYSVITAGPALGHGLWLDGEFLSQVASAEKGMKAGVKSRFTHPGLSSDGLGKLLGRASNFRVSGEKVVGDLKFARSAFNTPEGDLATYVMDVAEETPEFFGTSIVFELDRKGMEDFKAKHAKDGEFRSPDAGNVENHPHARLKRLWASDVVDDPAANPDGMFSSGAGVPELAEGVVAYALGLSEECPDGVLLGAHPERARRFVSDFLERRGVGIIGRAELALGGPGVSAELALGGPGVPEFGCDAGAELAVIDKRDGEPAAVAENQQEESEMIRLSKLQQLGMLAAAMLAPDGGGGGASVVGAAVVDVELLKAGAAAQARQELKAANEEVAQLCELHGCLDRVAGFQRDGRSPAEVREILLTEKRTKVGARPALVQGLATSPVGGDEREKFRAGAVAGVMLRMGVGGKELEERGRPYRSMKLMALARHCLRVSGGASNVEFLSDTEVLDATFTGRLRGGIVPRDGMSSFALGGPYNHTTSDLPNILRDAANKRLQEAYRLWPSTYQVWCRIASLSDFKLNHVVRLGEAPDPVEVGENGEIVEGNLFDGGESYSLKTFARKFSFTRQVLINDDLSALSRLLTILGAAFRRHTNRLVYNRLKSTTILMADGIALFDDSTHKNLNASAALSTDGKLDAAYTRMSIQTGLQPTDEDGQLSIIGVQPRWLLVPPQLRGEGVRRLNSPSDPAGDNAGVINAEKGLLNLVVEPELYNGTNGSASTWFVAADNASVDTFEVAFLDGMDAPTMEETNEGDILGMSLRAFMDVGVGVIDHRGLSKNTQ